MCFLWTSVGSHPEDQRRAVGRLPGLPGTELKKMLSMPGFRLSGSGWYETDFKTGSRRIWPAATKQTELNSTRRLLHYPSPA